MITVEKFLGCCELEKSLIVIAWLEIICLVLSILGYSFMYVKFMLEGCSEMVEEMLKEMHINDCVAFSTGATVAFCLMTIFMLGMIVVNYLLIRAAKTRNHKLLLPAMIVSPLVMTIVAISYISTKNPILVTSGILCIISTSYLWICLYSLYVRFRDEKRNFDNVQYQPA